MSGQARQEIVTEDTQRDKYLTFHLANEDYGIEIRFVTEIIGIQKITSIPNMANFIKGVINLRGKVIPVMDVRARFGLSSRNYDERTCVIVVNVSEQDIGLVVDRVNEVVDIPAAQVEPSPLSSQSQSARYIRGIGKVGNSVKILLDAEKLLEI